MVTPHAVQPANDDLARIAAGPRTLGIVGLGLIGGSVALAAVEAGLEVRAWDPDSQTRHSASDRGIEPRTSLADLVSSAPDVLLVAVPLRHMAQTMTHIAERINPRTTVTDVGSVKSRVREAVRAAGLDEQYVGAHPMAGTERSGFAAASSRILVGATWAVTLSGSTDPLRSANVTALITGALGGEVIMLNDSDHDRAAAMISHLPHVYAHSLTAHVAQSPIGQIARTLAAGSFRDGTRVARGDAARNAAMILDNRSALLQILDDSLAQLGTLRQSLAEQDEAAVHAYFAAGTAHGVRPTGGAAYMVSHADPAWRDQLLDLGRSGELVRAVRVNALRGCIEFEACGVEAAEG